MIKILESIDIQDLEEKRTKLSEWGIQSEVRDASIEDHVYMQGSIKSYGLFVSDNDEVKSLLIIEGRPLAEERKASKVKTTYTSKATVLIFCSFFIPVVMNFASLFYLFKSIRRLEISLGKSVMILSLNLILISIQVLLLVGFMKS